MESEPSRRFVPLSLTILLAMTMASRALAAPVPPGFGAAAVSRLRERVTVR